MESKFHRVSVDGVWRSSIEPRWSVEKIPDDEEIINEAVE